MLRLRKEYPAELTCTKLVQLPALRLRLRRLGFGDVTLLKVGCPCLKASLFLSVFVGLKPHASTASRDQVRRSARA